MAEKDKKGKAPSGPQLFFRETIGELRKVSWPTLPDAWHLTVLVLIVMAVIGVFLAFVQEMAILLLARVIGS